MTHDHILRAIPGGNPAGFLAAMGLLSIIPDAQIRWELVAAGYTPTLRTRLTEDELVHAIMHAPMPSMSPRDLPDGVVVPELSPDDPWYLIRSASRGGGATGADRWLSVVDTTRSRLTPQIVHRDLFCRWTYTDDGHAVNLRLDPEGVNRPYALSWGEPSKSPHGICYAAQWLGAHGVTALQSAIPRGHRELSLPMGWHGQSLGTREFVWPVWGGFFGLEIARALVRLHGQPRPEILQWFVSCRRRSVATPGPSPMEMSPSKAYIPPENTACPI